jgi:hypothetical protein
VQEGGDVGGEEGGHGMAAGDGGHGCGCGCGFG